MARARLLGLLAAAALVLGIALLLNSRSGGAPEAVVGSPVLPTLAAGLNDVSEVRIADAGNKPLVTLRRAADKQGWQVMERDGYRADVGKLRELLLQLSNLEVVEVKTSSATRYAQIGVEDIEIATATGKRVDIAGLKAPLGLIIGKSSGSSGHFVRIAGEATSYLARPQVFIYNDPKVWLDRTVPPPAAYEAVQEVSVTLAEGKPAERAYTVMRESRDQTDFTATKLPAGRKAAPGGANLNAGTLTELSFDDVRKVTPAEDWTSASRAEYRLFDGTVITVLGRKEPVIATPDSGETHRHFIRFEVSFDAARQQRFADKAPAAGAAPEAGRNAQALQAQLGGWVFEIPARKYDALFRPLDDLLAKD